MHILLLTHWNAESSMLASIFSTLQWNAFFSSVSSRSFSSWITGTFVARGLSSYWLIEVSRAQGTWSQSCRRIMPWTTLRPTVLFSRSCRLIRKRIRRTSLAIFEAARWWFARVAVARTFQARYETGRRVCTITADGYAIADALGAFFSGVGAHGATFARALTVSVLVETFRAVRAFLLFFACVGTSRTMH